MDSPFLTTIAKQLGEKKKSILRFEFPYMQMRRVDGRRRPPNPTKTLIEHWKTIIDALDSSKNIVIGGKSLGGRAASMIVDQSIASGLICLGYPFHPPGKPHKQRVEHLATLQTPTLILQGERDPLGSYKEVEKYNLSPAVRVHWLADGDHSFQPRKKSGKTEKNNLDEAILQILAFLEQLN